MRDQSTDRKFAKIPIIIRAVVATCALSLLASVIGVSPSWSVPKKKLKVTSSITRFSVVVNAKETDGQTVYLYGLFNLNLRNGVETATVVVPPLSNQPRVLQTIFPFLGTSVAKALAGAKNSSRATLLLKGNTLFISAPGVNDHRKTSVGLKFGSSLTKTLQSGKSMFSHSTKTLLQQIPKKKLKMIKPSKSDKTPFTEYRAIVTRKQLLGLFPGAGGSMLLLPPRDFADTSVVRVITDPKGQLTRITCSSPETGKSKSGLASIQVTLSVERLISRRVISNPITKNTLIISAAKQTATPAPVVAPPPPPTTSVSVAP